MSGAGPPPLPREARRRSPWRWRWWPPSLLTCGTLLLGVPFLLVMLVGAAIELQLLPPAFVLREDEIGSRVLAAIEAHAPLEPGERVRFFYGAGVYSYEEDGNVLTDRRAISWQRTEGVTDVAELRWEDLVTVEVESAGSFWEDALVFLGAEDESGLYLYLAVGEGREEEALEFARSQLQDGR